MPIEAGTTRAPLAVVPAFFFSLFTRPRVRELFFRFVTGASLCLARTR